jgi:hypothetical protein
MSFEKLPAQFVGDWCLDNPESDKGPATYRNLIGWLALTLEVD